MLGVISILLLSLHQQLSDGVDRGVHDEYMGVYDCSHYEFHGLAHSTQNGVVRLHFTQLSVYEDVL